MALNFKLRDSVSLVRVARGILVDGGFSFINGHFFYAYIDTAGNGIIKISGDDGRTWSTYDNLGQVDSVKMRGPWVAWSAGSRVKVYDINAQWLMVDASPIDDADDPVFTGVEPLPEIDSVRFNTGGSGAGSVKPISTFGLWDQPSYGFWGPGFGFGHTITRYHLGSWGDLQRRTDGQGVVHESYLHEDYYLGTPSTRFITVHRREPEQDVVVPSHPDSTHQAYEPYRLDHFGENLASTYGTRGMEGSLDGVSGLVASQRRLGFRGKGLSDTLYSVRMDGEQIGLRHLTDLFGEQYEWAHGGAWVDEFGIVAASGFIGGYPGTVFSDTAGCIHMVRRAGGEFGAWSTPKPYGNPGVAPESMWLPPTFATVRAGVYGGGQAWFFADDSPEYVPRGRLVDGGYLPAETPSAIMGDGWRDVTFWGGN